MKILVTGASGFIGGHAVREALLRGHRVIALSRSSAPPDSFGLDSQQLAHDLSTDRELDLGAMGIDVVVHLAASLSGSAVEQHRSTVRGTEKLLAAMKRAGIRALVGVSSIAVLDYVGAAPMSVIDESNPLCRNEQETSTYAAIKARQEKLFAAFAAEPGNRCVILRPGLVYDETHLIDAHAGILKGPLRLLVTHEGEVPVVSVAGVACAILGAVERDIASGQVIHLVDTDLPQQQAYLAGLRRRGLLAAGGIAVPWATMRDLTTTAYRIAAAAGLRGKLPEALLPQSFAGRMKPFRYSNAKAAQFLGWVPERRFF